MTQPFFLLRVSPGSPVSGTAPAGDHCASRGPLSVRLPRLRAARSPLAWGCHRCCERGGSRAAAVADLLLGSSCSSLGPGADPRDLPVGLGDLFTIRFQHPLRSLASKFQISWGSVVSSVCSSEDGAGVPAGCLNKWVWLPPTSLPSSTLWILFFLLF